MGQVGKPHRVLGTTPLRALDRDPRRERAVYLGIGIGFRFAIGPHGSQVHTQVAGERLVQVDAHAVLDFFTPAHVQDVFQAVSTGAPAYAVTVACCVSEAR